MTANPLTFEEVAFDDIIDLFCQFSGRLELAANDPGLTFIKRRMDFLEEEVKELDDAIEDDDVVEMIDGAADVAFIAITQVYHVFRHAGFEHDKAVAKTRQALMEVGRTNIIKVPPTEKGAKITKPEGWKPPQIADLLEG